MTPHGPATLWTPPDSAFRDSAMSRFALAHGFDPRRYDELHGWSVTRREEFWNALWDFTGVLGDKGDVVEQAPPADGGDLELLPSLRHGRMFGTRYFPAGRLNVAENLLRGEPHRLAVLAADETGTHTRLTVGELRGRVAAVQAGLRAAGVGEGDVVAGILPNTVENLTTMIATLSLGAAWAGCSPDFGVAGLVDRIGQVGPSVVVAAQGYAYNGRDFDVRDRAEEVVARLATTPDLVLVGSPRWEDEFTDETSPLTLERFPFDAPGLIMFTSGTTGLPKAIVHSAGGVLLQHLKEHVLHGDVRPGDVHSWFTSTAWMMYAWVVSVLAAEAAVLLIDGHPSPRLPDGTADHGHLWRMADEAGLTHFGTSPRYLTALMDSGYAPREHHDLSALRSVLSAGAPVSPEQYDWLYAEVKQDMVFASICGGTEIHGCFQLGSPLHPVRRGEITCIALGHAVSVLDERGAPVVGEKGELVCTEPFPSMPLTFLGEGGLQRYHHTYFAERPDVWTHGDLAEITTRRSVVVHGRSDTTLKPNGVRIGTAEIYRVVDRRPEVAESLVFGHTARTDEEVVLCLVMADGHELTPGFAAELRADIRTQASPRHVPAHVFSVAEVPYTLNGKKVEGAARTAAGGGAVKNEASLANPGSLDAYRKLFA
ncbi:acetoacetate--CoA ligase [Kocuria nitroreducens]|uniref:acetoacetate--CoA ligase n=1 Tax=Kocuria nitroreducens TaxID=3058914 RepID=UPI0036DC8D86